jgi:hypothetical protein
MARCGYIRELTSQREARAAHPEKVSRRVPAEAEPSPLWSAAALPPLFRSRPHYSRIQREAHLRIETSEIEICET